MWVLALAAAAADPLPADAAILRFVDEAVADVAARRGLPLLGPVPAEVFDVEALRARVVAALDEELSPEELDAERVTLALLGFCDPALDLRHTYEELLVEQISGFYDPEEGRLFLVRRGEAGAQEEAEARMVVEHELVHALQDQHFDIGILDRGELPDSDLDLAVRSLVEGDASFFGVMQLAGDFIDPIELPLGSGGAALDHPEDTALARAPDLVTRTLVFPYTEGAAFAQRLYADGGFASVDAAYARVPLSSEHILHPDRYLGPEPDLPLVLTLPDLGPALGPTWREIASDAMGELGVLSWLDAVGGIDATGAPLDWGGDRYATWTDGEAAVLAWLTTWDEGEAAARFSAQAQATLEARGTGRARGRRWEGPGALLVARGEDVAIVLGAERGVGRRVARALLAGATREERASFTAFQIDPARTPTAAGPPR